MTTQELALAKRLEEIQQVLEALADGNYDKRLEPTGDDDSIARSVNRMVDALRASAERLLQSDQSYRAAIEASPVAMLIVNYEHEILLLNSKTEMLFGYTAEELRGKSIQELVAGDRREFHTQRCDAYCEQPDARLMAAGRETSARHKYGSLVPVEIGLFPIETPDGNRVLVSVADLSERKKLDEELRRSQKLEAIGSLASGVAHEFNNLLMGVSGCTNIAISKIESGSPALMYLNEIKRSVEKGAAISQQLMEFARKSKTRLEVLNLNVLVSKAQILFGRLLGEDIEISVRLDAENGRVLADRGLMEQVLMNLVVNARDAMPNGGELAIVTRNVVLTEPTGDSLQPGEFVVLEVTDSGNGMTDKVKQHLFDPFFTTKRVGEGTGLGLSVAYGIIKEAGGRIQVKSQPNKGTTFEVLLPTTKEGPVSGDPTA